MPPEEPEQPQDLEEVAEEAETLGGGGLSCGSTLTVDTTLTADLGCNVTALIIGADDVTLDCQGHSIFLTDSPEQDHYGIFAEYRENIEVQDCLIVDFEIGIFFNNTIGSTILDNTIQFTPSSIFGEGISIFNSSNNTIESNVVNSSLFGGIFVRGGAKNRVQSNLVVNNELGMLFVSTSDNIAFNNTLLSSPDSGMQIYTSHNNTVMHNYFLQNQLGLFISDLSSVTPNLFYDNFFNNTGSNVLESTSTIHLWNISKTPGTNIVGGSFLGGNFWSDYSGTDVDADGLGDTNIPHTSGGGISQGGDSLPLVATTTIACGQTLTANALLDADLGCNGNGLTLGADSISLDCQGHSITGTSMTGTGITVANRQGVTIENCIVENFGTGISLTSSNGNTLRNNEANDNKGVGFRLSGSSNNLLENNHAEGNIDAPGGPFAPPPIGFNFQIRDSSNTNTLRNNTANNSIAGFEVRSASFNILTGNTAFENSDAGILLTFALNTTVSNNTLIDNNLNGLRLTDSEGNLVQGNNITGNNLNNYFLGGGVTIQSSSLENTLTQNRITQNNLFGVLIDSFLGNTNHNNTIYDNFFNNTKNAADNGTNSWNISKTPGTNIVGGSFLGGNFWNDYQGADTDGDGLGDTNLPYTSGDSIIAGDLLPLTGMVEPDFVYDITALASGSGGSFTCQLSGSALVGSTDFDKFITDIRQDCNADFIDSIISMSITFNSTTYPGDPESDIFITDKAQEYVAWIVMEPQIELHAAKKSAEIVEHPFNYRIVADGTHSPPQDFTFTITAEGTEDYLDTRPVTLSKTETMKGTLKKKCENRYFRRAASGGYGYTAFKETHREVKGSGSIDSPSMTANLFNVKTNVCNRGWWSKGWVTLSYTLTEEGIQERAWSRAQTGSGGPIVNGEENKLITTYTKGFGSGKGNTQSGTVRLENYALESSNPNVQLSMDYNTNELFAITFHTELWEGEQSGAGSINKSEGIKNISQSNDKAPNNDTQYSAVIEIACTDCPQPAIYSDLNDDGIVEVGQFIAWMDGFDQVEGPLGNILYVAFDASPPTGFIDNISPSPVALVDQNVSFTGHGEPLNETIDYWWRSHKQGRIGSTAMFISSLLDPANPHHVNFNVKSTTGLWSPDSPNSRDQLIINKPPTAYIRFIEGMTDDTGTLVALLDEPVDLNGFGFDTDGFIQTSQWIVDGQTINSAQATHTFTGSSALGSNIVSFRVQDDKGTWSKNVSREIIVVRNPVLLIHDYLRGPNEMERLQEALQDEGFSTFSADLRKPADIGVDFTVPLKSKELQTIGFFYALYNQARQLNEDLKELKALVGSQNNPSAVDVKNRVRKSVVDLQGTLKLISFKVQNQTGLTNALNQAINITEQIKQNIDDVDFIFTLLDSDNVVEDIAKLVIQNFDFTFTVKLSKEFKIADVAIPAPVPAKAQPIVKQLLATGKINIPGEATLFSKELSLEKGSVKVATDFALKVKNITPEFVDDGARVKGSFVISEIAVDLNPFAALPASQSAARGARGPATTDPFIPPTFIAQPDALRVHINIPPEQKFTPVGGEADLGIFFPAPETPAEVSLECTVKELDYPELFSASAFESFNHLTENEKQNLLDALFRITQGFDEYDVNMTVELLAVVLATLEHETGLRRSTDNVAAARRCTEERSIEVFGISEEWGDLGDGPDSAFTYGGGTRNTNKYDGGVDYKGRGYIQITGKSNYETFCNPVAGSDCVGTSSPTQDICMCKGKALCCEESTTTCPQNKALLPENAGKIFAYYYKNRIGEGGKNLVELAKEQKYKAVGKAINPYRTNYATKTKQWADDHRTLLNQHTTKTAKLLSCIKGEAPESGRQQRFAPEGVGGSFNANPPNDFPYMKFEVKLSSSLINLKFANQDIKLSSKEIGEQIDEIQEETGIEEVILIGSGMGGLAAHHYTNYGYRNDVKDLILIGAPLHGSDLIKFGPKIAKLLIDALAAQIPGIGQIIGEFAKAFLDIVLGDAAKQMEPHSSFIETLNLNGKDTSPEWALYEWTGDDDLLNNNVNYNVIKGVGPKIGSIAFPLTLTTISTTIPLINEVVRFPFIWTGDLLVNTISVELDNVPTHESKGFNSYHWWLAKDSDTIDHVLTSLGITTAASRASFVFDENGTIDVNATVNKTAYETRGPFEGAFNNSNTTAAQMHTVALDLLAEDVTFKLQYRDRDALWDADADDYVPCNNSLSLTLQQPNQTFLTPGDANNLTLTYLETNGSIAYLLDNPATGNWTMIINQTGQNCQLVEYSALVTFKTHLTLGVGTANYTYEPGDSVTLVAFIENNGTPVLGANVTAAISMFANFSLNGSFTGEQLQLFDDGAHGDYAANDGIYANTYVNTGTEDAYYADITAEINVAQFGLGNSTVTRSASALFFIELLPELSIMPSDISLSPPTPVHGDFVIVSALINNSGGGDATNAEIEFRDENETIGFDVINLTGFSTGVASVTWVAQAGTRDISVIISPFNEFQERNYLNNNATKKFIIGDNQPPFAIPEGDITARVGDPVFFDGSQSTDNDQIASYTWDTDVSNSSSTKLTGVYAPFIGYATPGSYTVQLTVTDASGNSDTELLQVNVTTDFDFEDPVAVAGPFQEVLLREPVQFSAVDSSDNYGIASHTWDIDTTHDSDLDGIPDNDVDLITEHPELETGYFIPGTYSVKLTVDDVAGNGPVSDFTKVIVRDPTEILCLGDADCDGIFDEEDNCPTAYNPFQEDYDNDGLGDACWCTRIVSGYSDVEAEIVASSPGDVICLGSNVIGGLDILRSDITLDCLGRRITGNGAGIGVNVSSTTSGVIVQNCEVSNHLDGVRLAGDAALLLHNVIENNVDDGIDIVGSGGVIFRNEVCFNGGVDMRMTGSYIGDDNICNATSGWNDLHEVGCTLGCGACTVPTDGMTITQDTLLCPGTYELPQGIFVGGQDFVTLLCQDTVLVGGGVNSVGILSDGVEGATVRGCTVENYTIGINFMGGSNGIIVDNRLSENTQGIKVSAAPGTRVVNNRVSDGLGIFVSSAAGVTLENNTLLNNQDGSILSTLSNSLTIMGNFLTDGVQLLTSANGHVLANTLRNSRGEHILHLDPGSTGMNVLGNRIEGSSFTGLLVESENNQFTDNTISSTSIGYFINASDGNAILNSTIARVSTGILFLDAVGGNVTNVTAVDQVENGISLESSDTILVLQTSASNFHLEDSDSNTITASSGSVEIHNGIGNVFSSHMTSAATAGYLVREGSGNSLIGSRASDGEVGIILFNTSGNTVMSNEVRNNSLGIFTNLSSGNTIYNNIFNNTQNVESYGTEQWSITPVLATNIVGGPYTAGNYWSDYTGMDLDLDLLGDTLTPHTASGGILNGGDIDPLLLPVDCGGRVLNDVIIYNDLDCEGDGITIEADNVTVNCSDSTITGNGPDSRFGIFGNSLRNIRLIDCHFGNFEAAVLFDNVSFGVFSNTTITDCQDGVVVNNSDSVSISDIVAYNNTGHALFVDNSLTTTITGITAYDNDQGIHLFESDGAIVTGNQLYQNTRGLQVDNTDNALIEQNDFHDNGDGIYFFRSNSNIINSNNFTNNTRGVFLQNADSNTITGNRFIGNDVGLGMAFGPPPGRPHSNIIYNNIFANNGVHASSPSQTTNHWNTTAQAGPNIIGGPSIGGNSWDDYLGEDVDGDGFGSTLTPHTDGAIGNGGDFLPLTAVSIADTDDPVVTPLSPADGHSQLSTTGTFNYNVNDATSAIANCSLLIDGISVATDPTVIEGVTQSFTYLFPSTGTYEWEIICRDSSTNANSGISPSRTFIIINDVTPPAISLSSPPNGYQNTGALSLPFQYSVTDATAGIAQCSLILNGATTLTDFSIQEGVTQSFSNFMNPGSYTWRIRCIDNSPNNNIGDSATRSFTIHPPPESGGQVGTPSDELGDDADIIEFDRRREYQDTVDPAPHNRSINTSQVAATAETPSFFTRVRRFFGFR